MPSNEIYGFWDLLFPIYLMFIIGISIFAISIEAGRNLYSLNLMGIYVISILFVMYLIFNVKFQIET
jgi:hypothetical protein